MANNEINAQTPDFDYEAVKAQFFQSYKSNEDTYYSISREEYNKLVQKISDKTTTFESELYEVCEKDGTKYLMKKRKSKKSPIIKYMCREDYFDAIYKCHITYNHLDAELLPAVLKAKYSGFAIPITYINLVIDCCNVCKLTQIDKSKDDTNRNDDTKSKDDQKRKNHTKSVTVQQTIKKLNDKSSSKVNEMVYIHVQDMKSDTDGNFKYLLICKDTHSTFVWLRPLMDKCSFEIATEIAKIFLSFGAPQKLLVNPLEYEFYEEVLNNLKKLCEDCDVVLERSWPQTIWCNAIVNEILNWTTITGSTRWSIGCHIVQLQLNQKTQKYLPRPFKSPYHCMFRDFSKESDNHNQDNQSEKESGERVLQTISLIGDDDDDDDDDQQIPRDQQQISKENTNNPTHIISNMNVAASQQYPNLQGINAPHIVKNMVVAASQQHPNLQAINASHIINNMDQRPITCLLQPASQQYLNLQGINAPHIVNNVNVAAGINVSHLVSNIVVAASQQHPNLQGINAQVVKEIRPATEVRINKSATATTHVDVSPNNQDQQHPNLQGKNSQLVKQARPETEVPIMRSATAATPMEVSEINNQDQQGKNSTEKSICNVCHTLIFKFFSCNACSQPAHLYCMAQSKPVPGLDRANVTTLVCFKCLGI
ncbi:hypothetical protein ABMA28_010145 [Loxostege sticticalis]|uniref:Integrase catalytic domain-containing protein n=1 Tax=Loxostege sticticalis TaxID=481309 RepID=A0ABD0S9V3_LOXSC